MAGSKTEQVVQQVQHTDSDQRAKAVDTEKKQQQQHHAEEDLERSQSDESEKIQHLTTEHRHYLLRRHGTLDLDPVPYPTDADPYNWPEWKKTLNLVLVALHAMMGTFNAASIIPAYQDIAEEFGVSIPQASYLTSLQIVILGVAPLFWRPLCNKYGRRPFFLFSLLASCVCNIGCARSYSYGSMAACRALVAFFISPPGSIGSAVVAECFFTKNRGRYMGVWTLLFTLGVPLAPFLMGFVAFHAGYRWIYWTLAAAHALQLLLYIPFGPETRYLGPSSSDKKTGVSDFRAQYLSIRAIDLAPIKPLDFIRPLALAARPCVMIPAVAYSMLFMFCGILLTVEIPQLFGEKFHFNSQQLGLQFLGILIGSVLGEQIGGISSDWWMNRRTKQLGARPEPEYRLWLSYGGTLLGIAGYIVFLIQIDRAPFLHWNVTPLVGAAIASAGLQLITTVFFTYAVDCYYSEAASIGVFITFVRQVWGFTGPFWFPAMFDSAGLRGSTGIGVALMVALTLIPSIFMQATGKRWRVRGQQSEGERVRSREG